MKMTYEQAVKRLEELTQAIERGTLNIDDLAKNLEEAKELLKFCKTKLQKVEEDVNKTLTSFDEE